jgi:hypothetical protein
MGERTVKFLIARSAGAGVTRACVHIGLYFALSAESYAAEWLHSADSERPFGTTRLTSDGGWSQIVSRCS